MSNAPPSRLTPCFFSHEGHGTQTADRRPMKNTTCTRRTIRRWLLGIAVLATPCVALASPTAPDEAARKERAAAAGAAEAAEAKPKSRLKFRSDRRCTCESALGERDIEEAEAAKAAAGQPATRREK